MPTTRLTSCFKVNVYLIALNSRIMAYFWSLESDDRLYRRNLREMACLLPRFLSRFPISYRCSHRLRITLSYSKLCRRLRSNIHREHPFAWSESPRTYRRSSAVRSSTEVHAPPPMISWRMRVYHGGDTRTASDRFKVPACCRRLGRNMRPSR